MWRINARFLFIVLVVTIVLAGGVHLLHGYQLRRSSTALRERALALAEQADLERAIRYMSNYLHYEPNDVDALAHLGMWLDRMAERQPRARLQAFLRLEEVLRKNPDREDVRRRVVSIAMDLERFSDARVHLEKLLEKYPDDAELNEHFARCLEQANELQAAVQRYEKAIAQDPNRVLAYSRLAALLRDKLGQPNRADQIMDDMVKANRRSSDAYLHRALYRHQLGLNEEASKDISEALKLAPGDVAVILAGARIALDRNRPEEARAFLREGLRSHPHNVLVYKSLAWLENQLGDQERALEVIAQGLEVFDERKQGDHPGKQRAARLARRELLQMQLGFYLQAERMPDAKKTLDNLLREGAPSAWADYYEGAVALRSGRWGDAVRLLEKARPELTNYPEVAVTLDLMAAQCYAQLGNYDRQLVALRRAVTAQGQGLRARLALAEALVAQGRWTDALVEFRIVQPYLPEVGVQMARIMILRNLRLPPSMRDFSEAEAVLAKVPEKSPGYDQVPLLRAEILGAQGKMDEARTLLEKSIAAQPKRADLRLALAGLAERQKQFPSAEKILIETEQSCGDSAELRLAWIRHWLRRADKDTAQKLTQLEKNLDRLPPKERQLVWLGLADAYNQMGAISDARRYWAQVAREQPNNLRLRLLLFDASMLLGDEPAVQQALQEIERIEGNAGVYAPFARASYLFWLLRRGQAPEGTNLEVRRLLLEARNRRPGWARLLRREGELDEFEGRLERALDQYLEAVRQGETDPAFLRRVVHMAYRLQRYIEADQVIRTLQQENPLTGEVQRLAAEVFLRNQDFARALAEAEKAVPPDSKDDRDFLWLGQIYWAAGEHAKAEKAFRRCIELDPAKPENHVALVQFLIRTRRRDEALKEMEHLAAKLAPEHRYLALGACYQLLDDREMARAQYEKAVGERPEDLLARRAAASFYLDIGDRHQAEPHLRKILDPASKAPAELVRWARRGLALVLAPGDYEKYQTAVNLLKENMKESPTAADRRTLAVILASRPYRSSRREAIAMLEEAIRKEGSKPEDHLLLAQLYEREGDWPKARQRLFALLATHSFNPQYVAYFASTLIQRGDAADAEPWVNKLVQLEPDALRTLEVRARYLAATQRLAQATKLLMEYVDNDSMRPSSKAARALVAASLLGQIGEPNVADKLFRQYVDQHPEGPILYATFLGEQGRVSEALNQCDKLWKRGPAELASHVSLRVLRASHVSAQDGARVSRLIQEAIRKNPKSTALVYHYAELKEMLGEYGEAERVYREILKNNPNNGVALNNLAWILAFRIDKAEEALTLINRAIAIYGPLSEMLDTRGVVYLTLNRIQEAVRDLTEASEETPAASRFLHLAAAYHRAGQRDAALRAFNKARELGIRPEKLHSLERGQYEQLAAAFAQEQQ